MKILITGQSGLARALADVHHKDHVTCVSQSNSHDIALIKNWGSKFLDCDLVYNCAYSNIHQLTVLEFFYQHWRTDSSKIIVNIGSRVTSYPRIENKKDYWPYLIHKQTLQQAYESMLPDAKCDIKLINPGPIDTDMIRHLSVPKFEPTTLAHRIKNLVADPTIKRVDLWV